jgi:adenylate cyclase
MSGDPEQEYFADGISEDIITGLSKLRWLHVIARNSAFAYKGKAVDVKRAARELGVRYGAKRWQPCTNHRAADRCGDR